MDVIIDKARKTRTIDKPEVYSTKIIKYEEKGIVHVYGELSIDFSKMEVRANFGRELEYLEKIALIRKIFYTFCTERCLRIKQQLEFYIEEFKFIDINSNNKPEAIIDFLLNSSRHHYNKYKADERILYKLNAAFNEIQKNIDNGTEISMDIMYAEHLTKREVKTCYDILKRFLKRNGYNGELTMSDSKEVDYELCYR